MLKTVYKLLRPKILLTCYLIAFLGSAAAGGVTPKTVFALLVLAAWYVHAASSNDYADRHIDAINLVGAKDRPLVSREISYKKLWVIHVIAGVLALLLASVYGLGAVIFMTIILLLDYAYSFPPVNIASRGILSQLMLPIAYVVYPLALGYWSVEPRGAFPWILAIGIYLGFTARLFLKDFRDVKGDTRYGKRTFLVRHGARATCLMSGLFGLASTGMVAIAVEFSPVVLAVLIVAQYFALSNLYKLAHTIKVVDQLPLIRRIANLASVSVLTVLVYFL